MKNDNKVIQTNITNKDIVIRIPKKFILEDFENSVEDYKIKGNKKTEFINEFTKLFREHIEDNDIVVDIYDELCDTDLVKEIEY
jgi:hypothetical protein